MTTYIKHPLIKKDSIESRLYQQILAGDVLKKGNTMVVAPTALGKTIVAILVAADRLQKVKNSKVLILSPSKPLAIQHEASFKEFLTLPCSSITGAVKTDERVKRWEESRIISATPQTIESDLLNGRYDLSSVSLVVFDECHHGVGAYSYVYLASRYVKESNYNLILGLTASPGSDKAMERLPELAGCQDTVIFPTLSFYKLAGDKEHLYSIYRVSGVAERYCLKTTPVFEESVNLGVETQFWPKLTARVPYIYLYYFRWPDEATIETSVALDGFTIYWRRE